MRRLWKTGQENVLYRYELYDSLSDFVKIWVDRCSMGPRRPTIVTIHFRPNSRWRTAPILDIFKSQQLGRKSSVTQPWIVRFHANLVQSLNTWHAMYTTNVQGQWVKGQGHSWTRWKFAKSSIHSPRIVRFQSINQLINQSISHFIRFIKAVN